MTITTQTDANRRKQTSGVAKAVKKPFNTISTRYNLIKYHLSLQGIF